MSVVHELPVAERGAVRVLDHLVGDPVVLVGLGDDLHRDVRHLDSAATKVRRWPRLRYALRHERTCSMSGEEEARRPRML